MIMSIAKFRNTVLEPRVGRTHDGNLIVREYERYIKENVEVGDGMTLCLWSDRHAYTVIKKTKTTVTLRRCKATLNPNWKPEWIPGGFAAHCTNQNEQTYTYEEDPQGEVITAHWSEKKSGYYHKGCHVIPGRHEFYDYNF